MFKCNECGAVFDEPLIQSDNVPYGEGTVPREFASCPHCHGSFEPAYPCKDCGEYFTKDELHSFYCTECVKENWDKPDDLFEFGEGFENKSGINQFALEMFGGIEGINDVLKLLLKSIFSCNPQMLQEKKDKFIEDYADDLAEIWEEKQNGQP